MKYSLRSLMIVAIIAPPLLALAWWFIAPVEKAEQSYGPGPPGAFLKALDDYERYIRSRP